MKTTIATQTRNLPRTGNNEHVLLKDSQAADGPSATAPRHRVIAIGASNLTRWLELLVRAATAEAAGPVDVHAVVGFGRSYGASSRFFGRELPGIRDCGVWGALGESTSCEHSRARSTGILTDVGNDIFYNVEVDTVLAWVEQALVRVRPHVDRLVLTGLPASVPHIGPTRFAIMRRILVPSCRLDHQEGLRRAVALNEGLRELAAKHGAVTFQGDREWYGWDHIHLKRRFWRPFIERLLGVERDAGVRAPALPRLVAPGMRGAAPETKRLFGRDKCTKQPSVSLSDGTTVSLY